ncbi:hypothetical protein PSCICE_31620 [Pseudomonas cichorii]|jgi:transposase|nr:hypothetical protein PSCICE_31620 [Pseudomonas cichorii]
MTTSKDKSIEVLGRERRRRWSVEEKLTMVRESLEPGQSVSVVARRNIRRYPIVRKHAVHPTSDNRVKTSILVDLASESE